MLSVRACASSKGCAVWSSQTWIVLFVLLCSYHLLSTHKIYPFFKKTVKTGGKKRKTLLLLSLLTFMSSIETLVNGQNMLKCKYAAMCSNAFISTFLWTSKSEVMSVNR